MVTKQEVRDYYAENRKDSNVGICPRVVDDYLSTVFVGETGHIYDASSVLCQDDDGNQLPIEYRSIEDIKCGFRAFVGQYVKDLQKIAEI